MSISAFRACALVLLMLSSVAGASGFDPVDKSTPPEAILLPPVPAAKMAGAADSVTAAMVAEVNQDSLYAFLELLTGEVPVQLDYTATTLITRYSYSKIGEMASDYLRDVLEGYGYTVEKQFYRLAQNLRAITFPAGHAGIAVGSEGRIIRTDDGVTWTNVVNEITTTFRDVDHSSGSEYVVVGNAGVILASSDDGVSWATRTSGVADRLEGVDLLPSGTGWASGKNGVILYSADNGASWSPQSSGVTVFLRKVAALNDTTAVVVGNAGTILKTVDGGATWTAKSSGVITNLYDVAFVGQSGWATGSEGVILHSTDGGESWSAQSSGITTDLWAVSFADASTGYATALNQILKTTDGGLNWTVQQGPFAVNIQISAAYATSGSEVWIAGIVGNLGMTSDGGSNWESMGATVQAGWSNIIATLPGTTTPEEEVVFVAHYDCTSEIPESLAPGADDNGSGTASVIEAARIMRSRQFERTIRFVLVSGEEQGLFGSAAYAQRAYQQGDNIVAVLNYDMVGWNDNYLRILSNDNSIWLGDLVQAAAAAYAPSLPISHYQCPTCTWSDHASFWPYGFDAVCGIEQFLGVMPYYHQSTDRVSTLNMDLLENSVNIAIATLSEVAGVDTTGGATSVEGEAALALPTVPRLLAPRPNPFNPTTSFDFILPAATRVDMVVYDAAGRVVRDLIRTTGFDEGIHTASWDGRGNNGRPVAGGIYFLRLRAGNHGATQKVLLIK